jgi:hypothetical protein
MKKKILRFPMLIEVSLRQKSDFWKDVFVNMAHGKAPSGCYITASSFLVSNAKGRSFSYFLGDQNNAKSPDQIGAEIVDILTKKMNFMSVKDRIHKMEKFNDLKEQLKHEFVESRWTDLKKKNVKDQLLELYVLKEKAKRDLDIETARDELADISVKLIFKHIASDDVIMKNGEIETIIGVADLG